MLQLRERKRVRETRDERPHPVHYLIHLLLLGKLNSIPESAIRVPRGPCAFHSERHDEFQKYASNITRPVPMNSRLFGASSSAAIPASMYLSAEITRSPRDETMYPDQGTFKCTPT